MWRIKASIFLGATHVPIKNWIPWKVHLGAFVDGLGWHVFYVEDVFLCKRQFPNSEWGACGLTSIERPKVFNIMYFPTLKPVDFPAKLHQFPQQMLKIHSFEMEQLFGAGGTDVFPDSPGSWFEPGQHWQRVWLMKYDEIHHMMGLEVHTYHDM